MKRTLAAWRAQGKLNFAPADGRDVNDLWPGVNDKRKIIPVQILHWNGLNQPLCNTSFDCGGSAGPIWTSANTNLIGQASVYHVHHSRKRMYPWTNKQKNFPWMKRTLAGWCARGKLNFVPADGRDANAKCQPAEMPLYIYLCFKL